MKKINFKKSQIKKKFLQRIHNENSFAKIAAEVVNSRNGNFYVDLPNECVTDRIIDLDAGGKTKEFRSKDHPYYATFVNTDDYISSFVLNFLALNPNHQAIFYETTMTVKQAGLYCPNVTIEEDDQEVFYILNSKNNLEEIGNVVHCACQAWYGLIVLVKEKVPVKPNFITNNFDKLKNSVSYVIAAVYDGEAYMVWEKDS